MKTMCTILSFFFFIQLVAAQNKEDAIVGIYLSQDESEKIEIYKTNEGYFGKIIWLEEPNNPKDNKPYTDTENRDKTKRNQPLLNLVIIRELKFEEDNVWKYGRIYYPDTGKIMECKGILKRNKLKLIGYWKTPFFGRTEIWNKLN
jgi:uncharacterized protein (DUF2147 family)